MMMMTWAFHHLYVDFLYSYLRRRLASKEGIVTLCVCPPSRLHTSRIDCTPH